MAHRPLTACNVLLVEDDVLVANAIADALRDAGAEIAGSAVNLASAVSVFDHEQIGAVVLDLNLKGELAFDFADEVLRAAVPLVFVTGYDPFVIPDRFVGVPVCPKPVSTDQLIELLVAAVEGTR